jgi:hypothetical protein
MPDAASTPPVSCGVAARVDAIVNGDKDLLDMGCFREISIIRVRDFLKSASAEGGHNPYLHGSGKHDRIRL